MTKEEVKEFIEAFAPLIISIVTLTNMVLSMKGLPCIEIDSATITQAVSGIAGAVSLIVAWWKNNNVTEDSQISQQVLSCMKSGLISGDEVLDFLDKKLDSSPFETETVEEEVKEAVQHSEDIDGQV